MQDVESTFTSPEEILAYLESDTSPLAGNLERGRLFHQAASMLALRGDSENARGCCAESVLFYAHAQEPAADDPHPRYLGPLAVMDGRAFADPDIIPDSLLDYFEDRVKQTKNAYLKARYGDFLWERGRGHVYARESIASHLQLVSREADQGRYHYAADSARRALWLAFALGDRRLTAAVIDGVTTAAEDWVKRGEDEHFFVANMIDKILSNSRFRDPSTLNRWKGLLEQALGIALEHTARRELLPQLARVLDRLGRREEARQCRIKVGEEWEAEGRERAPESALIAAYLYNSALEAYTRAGASQKVDQMKRLVRESYEKAETEFKSISHEFKIDFTDWDKRLAQWLELAPKESLIYLAASFWLIPSWEEAESTATQLMATAPLSQLIPVTTLDDGRPVSQPRTDEDQRQANVSRQYGWQLAFKRLYLTRALNLHREGGALTTEALVSATTESPVFLGWKIDMIRHGFDRYVASDFISALHILIPQIEDCLRRFLGMLGGSTTSMQAGKMREKSLDQILEAAEIKRALATIPPLHKYLEHVLVNETGLNLRNKSAHGLLTVEDCNADNTATVIHIYLLLGLLRVKE